MGCMHTLNAVFLLLDTALNSLVSITITLLRSSRNSYFYVPTMAMANGFLIIRLLMDASFHLSFSAISLVPACIFCAMELCLCDIPMGYSRLWFLMVRTDNNNIFQLFL